MPPAAYIKKGTFRENKKKRFSEHLIEFCVMTELVVLCFFLLLSMSVQGKTSNLNTWIHLKV